MTSQDMALINYASFYYIDNQKVSKKKFIERYWELKELWGSMVMFDFDSNKKLNMHTPTEDIKKLNVSVVSKNSPYYKEEYKIQSVETTPTYLVLDDLEYYWQKEEFYDLKKAKKYFKERKKDNWGKHTFYLVEVLNEARLND